MTGTGPFRGIPATARAGQAGRGAAARAEEHLGDRLAAFVDGELRDDQRERVQAHLVTCPQCKAEADEQRRLKSAVAGAIPPAVSASLLARLQGLPSESGGDSGGFGSGFRGGQSGFGGGGELSGGRRGRSYLAAGRGEAGQDGRPDGGFRIHPQGKPAPRSRRFAFAAAGAFSLAALALGGALPLDAVLEGVSAGDPGPGASAAPAGAGAHAGAGPQQTSGRSGGVLPGLSNAPFATVAPLAATQPLLSRRGGIPATGGLSPSPVDAISSAVPALSPTPAAAPAPAPTAAAPASAASSAGDLDPRAPLPVSGAGPRFRDPDR